MQKRVHSQNLFSFSKRLVGLEVVDQRKTRRALMGIDQAVEIERGNHNGIVMHCTDHRQGLPYFYLMAGSLLPVAVFYFDHHAATLAIGIQKSLQGHDAFFAPSTK